MPNEQQRSLTPNFPEYHLARHFLKTVDGVAYSLYRNMANSLYDQRGTPQETAVWAEPEKWIPERLTGDEQTLALRMWRESKSTLNPRFTRGCWYLGKKHQLLTHDSTDVLRVTDRGREFIAGGPVVADVDSYEGVLTVLRLVAERGPGRRSNFLPGYTEFCQTLTSYNSEFVIKVSLYDRLVNLLARGLVTRSGMTYNVADDGLAYLEQNASLIPGQPTRPTGKQSEVRRLADEIRRQARNQLAEHLSTMDAYKFEGLIKLLLEEMGYDDVSVTAPANDKGVDVVANIQLGISSVREVVQAKRHKGNISRPVLDQLRGSLHRFNAVRGTIITTGGFSHGTAQAAFESGAAPITLIDGEKLLDLLIEHGIGVSTQVVEYLEFAPEKLAQFDVDDNVEPTIGDNK